MPERTVLVTGAATGIGEACATHLAARGWKVFAGVRRTEDGERLAAAPGSPEPLRCDVTDEHAVDQALAAIAERTGGRLTAVVNNAGVAVGGPVEYLALDEWRRQFEVNVFGQLAVTRAALPLLRAEGPGARLVFIGSIGGRIANPMMAPYAASKHALEAIAESMRHELHPSDIRVVLIEPGAVRTPIWGKGRQSADELEAELPAEAVQRYQWALAAIRKGMAMQERQGVAPLVVAQAVERALTEQRPRARYPVGRDAHLGAAAVRLLPDSVRDALLRRMLAP